MRRIIAFALCRVPISRPPLAREAGMSPPNYAHFVIGGHLVLLNRANFQIADVFHIEIN
jgi:hypothetical protein